MEETTSISWEGLALGLMCMVAMLALWRILAMLFKRQDQVKFQCYYQEIDYRIRLDEVNEQNFKQIKPMFNMLICPNDDYLMQKDSLWISFLTRFEPVHQYPAEDYNPGLESILKKRIESSLDDIDTELNELQERESLLIKSRKKTSELEEIHEKSQRLLGTYEMLSNILTTSEAKPKRGKNGKFIKIETLKKAV